jgi:penicillin amidase
VRQPRGVHGPIAVERDAWGTPTVVVRDDLEAAFATGWLHAHDRLVQIILATVIGQGRLLEVVGERPFARRADRATRQLRLDHGLDEAVAAMPAGLRAFMDAYCAGFDQGAAARGRPWLLRALGLPVPAWTPRLVLLVQRVLSWFGLTSTSQLAKCLLGELVVEGVTDRALLALLGDEARHVQRDLLAGLRWPGEDALTGVGGLGGSNAFAIAGGRTVSGKAIVLAEFHLEVGRLPPPLYPIDIRYPDGTALLGMTAPGTPHILAGRNRHVAWSYTFGHADCFDLTVESCVAGGVAVGDQIEAWTRRIEPVRPRGGKAESWVMYDLPGHRTILGVPSPGGPALALRWRGLEDALADHLVLWRSRTARSVRELVAEHRSTRTLSTAAVFGDSDGNIAWMHNTVVAADRQGPGPRRRGPVDPHLPESARPVRVNPPEGFVSSANEATPGWTAFAEPHYRKQRLDQRLSEPGVWDLARAWQVTNDEHDLCAERLLPVWARVVPEHAGIARLAAWSQSQTDTDEGRERRHQFHVLHVEACRALLLRLLGRARTDALIDGLGLLTSFQESLDDVLALDRAGVIDAVALADVLREAWANTEAAHPGPTVDRAAFRNPVLDVDLASLFGVHSRPVRFPGGPTSLFQSRRVSTLGEELLGGPAFHLLMDLGQTGGRYNVAGGASEQRFGPGYGKGLDDWAAGRWKPIGPS